jgi:hypothetical protein
MKSIHIRKISMLAAASTLVFSGWAAAQATGGPSAAEMTPAGSSRPPAKEAIDACAGKVDGDKVQFMDAKNKKRKWVCVGVDGVLAARPGVATPARAAKMAK